MKYYGLNELREMFLNYFETKNDHLRLESFSLIPHNDKSLLLVNSGMAPLKPYFTGQETPPKKRVTTCQKCIRTPDIENVGKTARHGTFFEMLGNFSFGDYFKHEAIAWAWEFLTDTVGIEKHLLHVSVYLDDDEAYDIWKNEIGVDPSHIVRLGKEDNFWEIGTGPCGPCSEIYVDRGEKYGCAKETCGVGCDCDRYVEVWNLVFTQFNKDDEGNYTKLAHPNIDTGMGLERLAVVTQGVDNLFEADTIRYILDYICSLSNIKYGEDSKKDISVRVITDHIRSVVFMLSDGVIPSNEGRGYVLRRLFRRAVRHGKLLGIEGLFMAKTAEKVVETSKDAYPSLCENYDNIMKLINLEENRFNETILQGNELIKHLIEETKKQNKTVLSGEEVFKLYDTFGFPLELTLEIAEEEDLSVDVEGFNSAMKKQKQISSEAHEKQGIEGWKDELSEIVKGLPATVFKGYDNLTLESKIICLIANGEKVETTTESADCIIITEETPFYAQSGGEVGDIGTISGADFKAEVIDTIKSGDKFAHFAKVTEGKINSGDTVMLSVDRATRLNITRNHTTTHLLHKALKTVLGQHVNQAGSEVSATKLRFDFSHFEKMTDEEIKKVEEIVNNEILNSRKVEWFYKNIDEAKKMGATALFGEKYGKEVRIIQIEDFSMELCGGCHLTNTSQAGFFKILSETGIAAGVRRIEAVTGPSAVAYIKDMENTLHEISTTVKAAPNILTSRINDLMKTNQKLEKEVSVLQSKLNSQKTDDLFENSIDINGVECIVTLVENADMNALRDLSDKIRDKKDNCFIFLVSTLDDKGFILSAATKKAIESGLNAGEIIKKVASSIGSGGGGKADIAQAGFKDITLASQAVENAKKMLETYK